MKLHEKIKEIRQEKSLSLKELHRLIINNFKESAVTYRTLQRIESGDTDGRGISLHQISTALNMSLAELKKDTEEESRPTDFIKRNKRLGRYLYNEKAYAEILVRQNRNFLVSELILKPGGKTRLEQDPQEIAEFEKYVYCLKGEVVCFVGQEKFSLKRGDGLSFKSTLPHWFENPSAIKKTGSKKEARCLIFQSPRYI
jgi:transcriptional regulator with XRE-family HTH domain